MKRIDELRKTMEESLKEIMNDDLLLTMKEDEVSRQFIWDRMQELIWQVFEGNGEEALKRQLMMTRGLEEKWRETEGERRRLVELTGQ